MADLENARELYQRLGSRMIAYPLEKLGEVYRERGDWTLARAAYEEALGRTRATGDLQGLIPTLAGLARVLIADEPEEARRIADEALALGPAMAHVSRSARVRLGRALPGRPRARRRAGDGGGGGRTNETGSRRAGRDARDSGSRLGRTRARGRPPRRGGVDLA